jgi:DNA mismatch repair ATPase MutS
MGGVAVEKDSGTTALMRQYLDIKSKYPDAILFFRLGDFYEMFYEDAVYVSRVLSLTLTSRDKGKEDPNADVRSSAPFGAWVYPASDRARPSCCPMRAA